MEKFFSGTFLKLQISFFFWVWEGGRREGRRGRRRRGRNIPCNSWAVAMNLPCATSHSNASKLDAMFVDQCFIQREEKRRERRREDKENERREREERGEGESERKMERKKEREKRERERKRKKEKDCLLNPCNPVAQGSHHSLTDVLSSSRIEEKTILIRAQRTLHPFCLVSHSCMVALPVFLEV